MQQQKNLQGTQVWVTRPVYQAKALSDMVIAQGGQVFLFPSIAIEAVTLSKKMMDRLDNLAAVDYIIFISPNAVRYGIAELLQHGEIPAHLKLVTIGQASALKLQQLTKKIPDISPSEQYNSEALLAQETLRANIIENKRFIIFRGQGGRELLADTLKQRGAIVHYAEVYRRLKPKVSDAVINEIWKSSNSEPNAQVITLTSNEGLQNLVEIFAASSHPEAYKELLMRPLIVVTEKMLLNARELGFKNDIIVAEKASNKALIQGLLRWRS